jgi:hypothetical protein
MKTSFEKFMASSAVNKVELSVINDLEKLLDDVDSVQGQAESLITDYNSMANKIIGLLNTASQGYAKVSAKIIEAEKYAKDLGIPLDLVVNSTKRQIVSEGVKAVEGYKKKLASNKIDI